MGLIRDGFRKLTKAPGAPQARHLAERAVTPYLRRDLHELNISHGSLNHRLVDSDRRLHELTVAGTSIEPRVEAIETHLPTILNAIASTSGTARILARQAGVLEERIDAIGTTSTEAAVASLEATVSLRHDLLGLVQQGDEQVREEMRSHVATIAWLLQRVEVVRAEMMHELRYGADSSAEKVQARVINAGSLDPENARVNLGAGHIPIPGYINVDARELPGIDVVASVDDLPFEPASLAEIFSSHTIEHFPELQLRRQLLPYWVGLLKSGGEFRAVAPDLEAMSQGYANGSISFEQLRSVLYGGQEYAGDFHFTGFTPDSLADMLREAGLSEPKVVARGRPNGDCLEFEVSAIKSTR